MVDAGNSPRHSGEYQQDLEVSGMPRPKYCVITHWHWDHTFAMHALPSETIASRETARQLQRRAGWRWDAASMESRLESGEEIPFAHEHICAEYKNTEEITVALPNRVMENRELALNCGGITCRCIQFPSVHSDDSVVACVPEEKVIFIGDIYGDDFYNNHYRDLEKTKQLQDALAALDFTVAVPGHSEPLEKHVLMAFLEKWL